ncbi:MAG TPA: UDP-3-O-(3-hydroxymyristoyl)glucosamine N-acyltransferase [Acidobacteriaceae bacterium]|jgi:UDP-3-O-[3-hydroxymyristoyl] glucosamine N-acyltransferase|nr:UDP-3-O-(3-hydroxymyristoyl)glucosamine N-acyltransferase [Acidobacteriaceae bacterium]
MKLAELARQLGARLECSSGSGETEITGVAGIENAAAGQVTFVANPKYAPLARTTQASAVLVTEDFPAIAAATLRLKNPYLAFARAIEILHPPPVYAPGIHPTAVIHATAKLGRDCHVGAYVVIDANVIVGDQCVLLPHVVVYQNVQIGNRLLAHAHAVIREGCRLGDDVVLQNGAVVGCDGFGFAKDDAGRWHKIPQSGPTILEDAVEVQSNACVDRASVGETRIGRGVKIDNLAQVGHGSSVGENTLLCAQVGLAGSSHLGRNVIAAGQAGVAGHCNVGDGVVLLAQSGVHGDIPPGSILGGSPGFDSKLWLRCVIAFQRLPELVKLLPKKKGKE